MACSKKQGGAEQGHCLPQSKAKSDRDTHPGNHCTGQCEQQLKANLDPEQGTFHYWGFPQDPEVFSFQANRRRGNGADAETETNDCRCHREQWQMDSGHLHISQQFFLHNQGCHSGRQQHDQTDTGIPEIHGRAKKSLHLLLQKGFLLPGGGLGGEPVVIPRGLRKKSRHSLTVYPAKANHHQNKGNYAAQDKGQQQPPVPHNAFPHPQHRRSPGKRIFYSGSIVSKVLDHAAKVK